MTRVCFYACHGVCVSVLRLRGAGPKKQKVDSMRQASRVTLCRKAAETSGLSPRYLAHGFLGQTGFHNRGTALLAQLSSFPLLHKYGRIRDKDEEDPGLNGAGY